MTDTLKNLASSVDWKKLMSSSDAKNALIGSALGGIVLGGASLAADRDPEESKLTPIGDALTGALLGGVAGYGVPKGLSLFFNGAGTMAPDNDRLKPDVLPALVGGAAGSGLVGLSLFRTFRDAKRRMKPEAAEIAKRQANIAKRLRKAEAGGWSNLEEIRNLSAAIDPDVTRYEQTAANLRSGYLKALLKGDLAEAKLNWNRLTQVQKYHDKALKGYTSYREILNNIGSQRKMAPIDAKKKFLSRLWRRFTDSSHYADKPLLGIKSIGTKGRMFLRGSVYGALGAALGLGAGKLKEGIFGSSPHDNFKN